MSHVVAQVILSVPNPVYKLELDIAPHNECYPC